jgi:tripartite-type tricarboxylate transporter receptor subunit TctC
MRYGALRVVPTLAMFALLVTACQPRTGAAPPPAANNGSTTYDERAVANYYQGKTVRFVVGFAPGGGYDTYTRTIARHIGKYIPGNPSVIVDNMPGGGSLAAANFVYGGTRPDGLTIGNFSGGMVMQQLLGGDGIEFDARKFHFLGVPTPDNVVCAVKKDAGFTKLSELINSPRQVILGGTAPGASTDDSVRVLSAALGVNAKLVSGYSGTATVRQAAENGEVNGGCWAWESIKVTWKSGLDAGDVVVLGQATRQKLPDLPDVELASDLAKTPEDKELILDGLTLPSTIARPYAVHPDTPGDRVQALRQAFMAVFKDAEFLDEAQKAGLDVAPLSGEEVDRIVSQLFAAPEPVKARLKTVLVTS